MDAMRAPEDILQSVYGHSAFRQGQRELIDAVLHHNDALGIMPTGAGKSLCYQVPGLMMRGLTLVISPLISLMKDQVRALTEQGVAAAFLNSSLSAAQYDEALRRAAAGQYKIIYVAPERLFTERFAAFAHSADISMLTVDEAHCVSQWGQDFRPSYLKITQFVASLPRRPILSAFTATATARVRRDIVELLGLDHPHIVTTGFDRPNLHFAVRNKNKRAELLGFLEGSREASGIIYCATRKKVEEVCDALRAKGHVATRYHAGLPDAERRQNQDDFLYDRSRIMVATNAFGMGIDKSDVRFVIHYNMPGSLENYYQEAGRAGRDGEKAVCLLLYSPQDVRTQQFLINVGEPNEDLTPEEQQAVREHDLERLRQMTFYATADECLRGRILRYFGEEPPGYCGNCSVCLTGYEETDITEDAKKILSCVVRIERKGRRFGKTMVADVLRGSDNERLRAANLNTLPTYGVMADSPQRHILAVIDYLLREGYLALYGEEYPVITTTEKTMGRLQSGETLIIRLPQKRQPKAERAAAGAAGADVDPTLLAQLKEQRLRIAKGAGIPAYMVFSDATLADICRRLPRTEEDFLAVSGVGREKNKRYGEVFRQLVREHLEGQQKEEEA